MRNLHFTTLILAFGLFVSNGQAQADVSSGKGQIDFEENLAQYPERVKFKVGIGHGTTLYMEQNCFTYVKFDPAQLELIHENSHQEGNNDTRKDGVVDLHAFRMTFQGANPAVVTSASRPRSYYTNYFIGNDASKWASNVASYEQVVYSGLYNGIDLSAYSVNDKFKYDFIVAPGADPDLIKMNFSGTDGIEVRDNLLVIHLSTGDIIEQIPYSYQEINQVKHTVACEYKIEADGRTVSFYFPNGYNKNYTLTIDPVVVAATFSGALSSTTTYGHCATYDPWGNIFTGGECFNPGYPTQSGSYQTTFAGSADIVVSCLNPNGSGLFWSTYLGGTGREIPNSLYAVTGSELYILGATNSTNFPTTAGCYDATYNGTSGSDDDIIVTHINSNGTALIGSTYVGGVANDGGGWSMMWNMNGHDGMRGEIIVDALGNSWVASFTQSSDFPVTPTAFDTTLGGNWDGVAFRLDPTCSILGWSTFVGGSSDDGAYGLRLNSSGEVFCAGVTCSNDFPATIGTYSTLFNGATDDGFIARFNATGSALLAATYFGSAANEICYFIDLDATGNPYVFGVSDSTAMPVTPGVYSNPGSLNFISKFDPGLTALQFSTVFGDASSTYLEPEAFMVDANGFIYCSGFNSQANYPVTPATALYATQASCGNGSCYFLILDPNATQLYYGSFYYGWHVDGGTSRFSPTGTIYQGICIGSGNAPTPAWAFADSLNTPSWDMYVVKINFEMSVGIQQANNQTENDIVVFPNPANAQSQVEVHSSSTDLMELHIYNSLGQEVWKESVEPTGNTTNILLPNLDGGHYTIVVTQAGIVRRSRFIAL